MPWPDAYSNRIFSEFLPNLSEDSYNGCLNLIRQKVAVSPALLLSAMAHELVDNPLVDVFARQAGNERVAKHMPPSQILPFRILQGVFETMVECLRRKRLTLNGEKWAR